MERFILQIGQSRAILALIIIIGLVLGYSNYSQSDVLVVSEIDPVRGKNSIDAFENFTIDFSILENEIYKSLEIFGENPVDAGITGERRNPFLPID